MASRVTFSLSLVVLVALASALPDAGRWELIFTPKNSRMSIPKSMYKGSQIFIQAVCNQHDTPVSVTLQWTLTQSKCWKDFYHQCDGSYSDYSEASTISLDKNDNHTRTIHSPIKTETCSDDKHIVMPDIQPPNTAKSELNYVSDANNPPRPKQMVDRPVFTIPNDGIYLLTVIIAIDENYKDTPFNITVSIKMRGTYGYLSAVDWPFLPFYGSMCGVYVCLGIAWLIVCWLQWRDILRIQFWIGAVVFLGMLEKATFYAVYSSINSSGISVRSAILVAEWVSVAKRVLARMLVIIVSLGFGIVKPRLGPMLQRVVGLGILWGALAALEAWLRIGGRVPIDGNGENEGGGGDGSLAATPLALLDAGLCCWVFASLINTTRTLRLRRNMVKLSLYKHFTNTLIFAVLSSIVFMLYFIKEHCLADCLANWKELWIDEAYWHILFSVILLVIMILWRPTNNNQRYAFTPLLDNPDDDDEEEEHFVSDAYGVKIRGFNRSGNTSNGSNPLIANASGTSNTTPPLTPAQREEADLKWVEDNIPTTALSILDSDEEILNAKFEVSKMQ